MSVFHKAVLIEVPAAGDDYVAKEMAGGLGKRLDLRGSLLGGILNRHLRSHFSAPPVVLAQVASVCRALGVSVQAAHTGDPAALPADCDIAFVLGSMVDFKNELDFLRTLKARRPDLKTVMVGSFATTMPEVYEGAADLVIQGSPEEGVRRVLEGGLPPEKRLRSSEPADLDTLPMLDWTPFLAQGRWARRPFSKDKGVAIHKSRGCTMTCNYCPYAAIYGDAKLFSHEHALRTIRHYYDEHAVRYFMFRDPNFGERRKDFREFMRLLLAEPRKITWSCEMRLDTFEDADLELMCDAGLRYVITGIESSNDEILKANMRRPYKKDDTRRKLAVLERRGVVVQTNWIVGFSGESEDSVRATLAYARELNAMFATFHIFTPQPGTDIFEGYRKRFLDEDWEKFSYSHLTWRHDTLSKGFLEDALHQAYVGYYFRLAWFRKHWRAVARVLV
ncbi:MAG: radical SAM protein [Elusimicrobia bacterium]|nr:radical SAM protein [Elusimicrobiota bacterium]